MAIRRYIISAFLVCIVSGSIIAQGPQVFNGYVGNVDDQAVRDETVEIRMGGTYTTSSRGEFTFPESQNVRVNSEVRFHVRNWIVIKPCELQNGRMYLPPPARGIEIEVIAPTDQRLMKIAAAQLWMKCLVEEAVSQFNISLNRSDEKHTQVSVLDQEKFLSAEAAYFGVEKDSLESALADWVKTSKKTTYEQGLSELYTGGFPKARDLLQAAVNSPEGQTEPKRLVPLARAKYELGDIDGAKADLNRFLADHPNDSIATKDVEIVNATLVNLPSQPSGLTVTVK